MYKLLRIQIIVLMVSIIFYATYAFASSNSGFTPGGEGVNTISGWVVSNVSYRLSENSALISAVEFDLDNPAGTVKASVNPSSGAYFTCINTNATHWVCNVNQESLSTADTLTVIATDT